MPPRASSAVRSSWWLLALPAIAVVAVVTAPRVPPDSVVIQGAEPAAPSNALERSFYSEALVREMAYTVVLPPGYSEDQRYPVLYMLHGIGENHTTEWPGYGLIEQARALMNLGDVRPFIIVLPEGEDGYWVDHVDGPAWGTYVARDLVAEVDRNFHTAPDAAHRAVGGNSMGGHGALQLAMTFPDTFDVVGAHSPTLRPFETAPPYFGDEAQFAARDPASIADARPQLARVLRISIDVGDRDAWLPGVQNLHDHLVADEVPHTFEVLPGDHSDAYWTNNVGRYLRWYGTAFAP